MARRLAGDHSAQVGAGHSFGGSRCKPCARRRSNDLSDMSVSADSSEDDQGTYNAASHLIAHSSDATLLTSADTSFATPACSTISTHPITPNGTDVPFASTRSMRSSSRVSSGMTNLVVMATTRMRTQLPRALHRRLRQKSPVTLSVLDPCCVCDSCSDHRSPPSPSHVRTPGPQM